MSEKGKFTHLTAWETLSNGTSVVNIVDTLIQEAVSARASDIHFEPQFEKIRVRYRVDGMLRDLVTLPKSLHAPLVSRLKIMAGIDIAEKRLPQDGRLQVEVGSCEINLRVSTLPTIFGEKIVIRILNRSTNLLNLDEIGFAPLALQRFDAMLRQTYGMILLTGPTGSGKTTTLYAALKKLNTVERNIVTIEDPVEYVLDGINQTQVNPKAGLNFAKGLRAILRQDPDVIMVGEIRDAETADIAVRAAMTGHLVLSTLHTNNASGALTRLIDMGIEPFLVASSIVGIVAQRLVRVVCPHCSTAEQLPAKAQERVFLNMASEKAIVLYRGKGCEFCGYTGYYGRTAIEEVMQVDQSLRELIINKSPTEKLQQMATRRGMVPLKQSGIQKALQGLTTLEEIIRVSYAVEE